MVETLLAFLGWSVLLLSAAPAAWTGIGAVLRPPHRGARGRGVGVLLVALVQGSIGLWLIAAG